MATATIGRRLTLTSLPALALFAACGGADNGSVAGAPGTLDGPDMMVSAVTEDVFTAGSAMGDGWDVFGSVQSVHFDAHANLHIFDPQGPHILVVGPDGSLIRTVGGRGEGPGEFGSVTRAVVGRDGASLAAGSWHADLFDANGEFVRRIIWNLMTTGTPYPNELLPDGRLLAGTRIRLGGGEIAGGIVEEAGDGRPIFIFPLDGAEPEVLYTAWEPPDYKAVQSGPPRRAFEPGLHFDLLSDGSLALIDSIGYRVKLVGPDGALVATIERPIAPLPVDNAIRDAERERNAAPNGRSGVEEPTFADEVPVLRGLEVDWADRIWLTRNGRTGADDGPTDIVTPAGEYLGTLPPDGLRTPDAFGPNGLMAYVERDELGVASVRVIRLVGFEPGG